MKWESDVKFSTKSVFGIPYLLTCANCCKVVNVVSYKRRIFDLNQGQVIIFLPGKLCKALAMAFLGRLWVVTSFIQVPYIEGLGLRAAWRARAGGEG